MQRSVCSSWLLNLYSCPKKALVDNLPPKSCQCCHLVLERDQNGTALIHSGCSVVLRAWFWGQSNSRIPVQGWWIWAVLVGLVLSLWQNISVCDPHFLTGKMASSVCFSGDKPSLILYVANVVQSSCNAPQFWVVLLDGNGAEGSLGPHS